VSTTETRAIAFSRDRPLQLDGMLRSLDARCVDRDAFSLTVLWTATSDRMRALYHQLARAHPGVAFVAETDFRRDVRRAVRAGRFVLFLVDDAIFVREFRIADGVAILESNERVLGVSLRLGRNTTHCYPIDRPQALPTFRELPGGLLSWDWASAEHDFGYPLEVSSSLYRAADLEPLLARLRFRNPNTLEGMMARSAHRFGARRPELAAYPTSIAFCAPMNVVQAVSPNRAGTDPGHTPEALADLFDRGYRMNVEAYIGYTPRGCHEEVQLSLADPTPAPTVSVVTPCYEQAEFLPDAVASLLDQTFSDWELVVVDDGSPDDTVAVAQGLIEQFGSRRIALIRQANAGVSAARNAGIAATSGRFILPLDADDRLDPDMLAACVAELEARPDAGIVYTDVVRFGASERVAELPEFDADLLCAVNPLPYCAMFRRGVWDAVGGYNPNMAEGYEDWDFWVGAVDRGFSARRIPRPLFHYRVKPESRDTRARSRRGELVARIAANHPALYTAPRRLRRRFRLLGRRARGAR
jgi:hypothetical protein